MVWCNNSSVADEMERPRIEKLASECDLGNWKQKKILIIIR